ncbi:probable WRKY transcription factor 4 [Typha angustifolia]|uniref:probable WRKY transcription factor 4 n=1 Tax=Typha angustifolia TaxID=59011 RepID=UPI003C2F3590
MTEEKPSSASPLPEEKIGAGGGGGSDAAPVPPSPADRGSEAKEGLSGDGRSFSQLLAGAMGSPRPGIVAVPVVAVPCFLAPAGLIEPPGFKGQFAMTHQAVLASVTAQAQMQLQASNPSSSELLASSFPHPKVPAASPIPLKVRSPPLPDESCITESVKTPSSDQKSQSAHIAINTTAGDGYNWRKYGQKQVKSSENSRSYYRCTTSGCSVKKKVENCPDGRIVEIIYRGTHNHEPPQKTRHSKERGPQHGGPSGENEILQHPSGEPNESDNSASKTEQSIGHETPERQLYCSSDCEGDPDSKTEEDPDEGREPKRRMTESTTPNSASVHKTVREPKIVVQTACTAGNVSDGYRWRKYGQKIVKGNPNPRSYYRCTHDGCPVRKHVEKASGDAEAIVITYEGKHNHDLPTKTCSESKGSPLPLTTATPAAGESPIRPSSLSDCKPAKETLAEVEGKSSGNKALELGGKKALESAQTLLSISFDSSSGDGGDRTSTDGTRHPLVNKSSAAVPVQNT